MSLGADYSWARPGGAALRAAGVVAVGRYLAADGRGITAAEYQDLRAHGIGLWLVREGSATGMLGGFTQGAADARIAVQQIAAAGLPANSVVHAAADWDVTTAQFGVCDDYMRGFASVIGVNRTGIYAGLHYMNHAHASGLAVSFWQAGATSWNHGEAPQMPINFVQTTLTPPLPGTDHNYINTTTTLAGSDAILLEDDLTPQQATALQAIYDAIFKGGPSMPDGGKSIGQSLADVKAVVGRPVERDGKLVPQIQDNADTGTLVRQLVARDASPAVAIDYNALAAAIVAQLPATSLTKQDVIDALNSVKLQAG